MTRVPEVLASWPFAPQAVGLYTHAMAWKGANVLGFRGDDNQASMALGLDPAILLQILPDYLINGRVAARVANEGGAVTLARAIDAETSFEVITPKDAPMDEFGRSVFESATANHEITIEMKKLVRLGPNPAAEMMLQTIRNDVIRTFSLPEWMYRTDQAAEAEMWAVLHAVDMFRIMVSSYRDGFTRAVVYALRDWFSSQDPPIRHPTPVWFAEHSSRTGVEGLDGIYWAFRECGLPLTRFGVEFPAWLRKSISTIPLPEYRAALRSWEEMGL